MTGMLITGFRHQTALLKRWLGLLLVVFIFYGTTVEAAHRHGRILPAHNAAALAQSEPTSPTTSAKTGCGECLICQLHQNFSTTLLATRPIAPPFKTRVLLTSDVPPAVLLQIAGPTSGRAPPFIS